MNLDLYEFKETLKKIGDKKLKNIDFCEDKGVAVIEVGKSKFDKELIRLGYEKGERVLVVVQ